MIVDIVPTTHEGITKDPLIKPTDRVDAERAPVTALISSDIDDVVLRLDLHPVATVKEVKAWQI